MTGGQGRVKGVEQRVWPLSGPCLGLEPPGHPTMTNIKSVYVVSIAT